MEPNLSVQRSNIDKLREIPPARLALDLAAERKRLEESELQVERIRGRFALLQQRAKQAEQDVHDVIAELQQATELTQRSSDVHTPRDQLNKTYNRLKKERRMKEKTAKERQSHQKAARKELRTALEATALLKAKVAEFEAALEYNEQVDTDASAKHVELP